MNLQQNLNELKQNFLAQKNQENFQIKKGLHIWFGLNEVLNETSPQTLEMMSNQTFPANSALEVFQTEVALALRERIQTIFHKYLYLSPVSEEQAHAQQVMFNHGRQPICRVLVSEENNGTVLVRAQTETKIHQENKSPIVQKMGISFCFDESADSTIGSVVNKLNHLEKQVQEMAYQSAINGVSTQPEFNHALFNRDYANNEYLESQAYFSNPFLNTQGQQFKLRDLPMSSVFETKDIPNVWLALGRYKNNRGEEVQLVTTSHVLDSILAEEHYKLPKHPAMVHFSTLTAKLFSDELKKSVYRHFRDFYLDDNALIQQVQTKITHNHELVIGDNKTPKEFNGTFSIRLLDGNKQEVGQKTIDFDFKETDSTQEIWEKRTQTFNKAINAVIELGREYVALSHQPQSKPASIGVDVRETDPFAPKLSDMYNL